MQMTVCRNQQECYFGNFPTLALVKKAYKVSASYWIVPQLMNLSQFCGSNNKLQGKPLEECAELIAQNYYYLQTSEIMLFFYRFKLGKYGRFYGSIDPIIIMQALQEFVTYDRNKAIEDREHELREREYAESVKNAVSHDQYLAMKKQQQNDKKKL